MEKDIKRIFLTGIVTTIILVFLAIFFFKSLVVKPEETLESYKFMFDVLQTIIVGFLIAIVGLIVPQLLARTKYNFEFLKEGKELYSEVKTGIDYLPYKIPFLNFKESLSLIEEIHQKKHLTDLYDDKNGESYWKILEEYKAYEKLTKVRDLIKTEQFNGIESQVKKMEKIENLLEEIEKTATNKA